MEFADNLKKALNTIEEGRVLRQKSQELIQKGREEYSRILNEEITSKVWEIINTQKWEVQIEYNHNVKNNDKVILFPLETINEDIYILLSRCVSVRKDEFLIIFNKNVIVYGKSMDILKNINIENINEINI